MTAFGIVNLLAAGLELCVPSYALRLVRRFGAGQVGSFIVIAFLSLALLHVVNPIKAGPSSSLTLSLVYLGASVLLLIGMGHTETVCRQRQQAQLDEESLRARLDSEAKARSENLVVIKQQMAHELVRLQQQLETLSTAERQYRLLFINHPHPMWIFDLRSGRVLAANESALAQYGFTQQEFTNLCAKDLIAREAAAAFIADAAKPCSCLEHRGIWRHRKKDRSFVDVDVMTVDMRFGESPARLVFAEDVSPRVVRETELCEQQRARILRRVAEGVAHHFGQIMTIVEGQASLLRDGRQEPAELENFEQMLAETRRGSALVRQVLAVGGCEAIRPEPLDLNQWLQGQRPVLSRLLGERISLQFHLTDGLAPVLADARVLEWITFNLILNARQALPQGGCIDLQTDSVWIDPRQKQRPPGANPGHFIRLAVRDNGCGMTAEVQQHLFEPFFSTRDDDKAMGLGLASVYGAAKQHGGWVEFTSEPQHGSEFAVYLPVASLAAQTNGIQEPAVPAPSRGTVMLVEADDRVRDLARHILQRNGYHVIEADNASTALLLLESQAQSVHLLLTDLAFPSGPDGRELAAKLRLLKSDVKVVYSSAPLAPEDNEPVLLQEAKLLFKPYTPDQLLQTVGSCLA